MKRKTSFFLIVEQWVLLQYKHLWKGKNEQILSKKYRNWRKKLFGRNHYRNLSEEEKENKGILKKPFDKSFWRWTEKLR